MRHYFVIVIMILIMPILICSACERENDVQVAESTDDYLNETAGLMKDTIKIIIGKSEFKATLEANAAATAFKAMLPLTINMTDLNSNEKYFDLPKNLPANASNPRTINSGDLMLWGSNTLVLFYKTFSTSYSYTRLGKIEDADGLLNALGSGDVMVIFELQN
jgi:hypothetical protein